MVPAGQVVQQQQRTVRRAIRRAGPGRQRPASTISASGIGDL
jgi:hypothetical protein